MPKYEVTVVRTECREHTFVVDAVDASTADEKVKQECLPNCNWDAIPIHHGDEIIIATKAVY